MTKKILLVSLAVLFLCSTAFATVQMVHYVGGRAGTTLRAASTDTAQNMKDDILTAVWTDSRGRTISRCVITCENNPVRFAFGTDAVQSGTPLGHILYVGQSLAIESPGTLANMSIISAGAGLAGVLMITPEYTP